MGKPWSDEEVQQLKDLYSSNLQVEEIAEKMERSRDSIWQKAVSLNISHGSRWTKKRVDELKTLYQDPNMTMEEICKRLDKTYDAIIQKTSELRIERARIDIWTEEEIDILRSSYQDLSLTIDDIAKSIGRTECSLISRAMKIGITRYPEGPRNNPSVRNESVFASDTPDAAYWAGFLMADGNVHHNGPMSRLITLTLKGDDERHVASFIEFTDCTLPIKTQNGKASISFSSYHTSEDLIRWGVVPRKTYVGSIPSDMDPDMKPHFIRGLIDGDGGIYTYGKRNSIRLANNESVISSTRDILNDAGIISNTYVIKDNKKTGHITYALIIGAQEQIIRAIHWLQYDNPETQALPRKRERALRILEAHNKNQSAI